LVTVSVLSKHVRNRRSKCHERKDGDLMHVRKAGQQR
jgi:hypothetical protein